MNKYYLKGELRCLSPLAIGSGAGEFTDKDVLLDSDGKPYIPGSTMAGVCRHYLETAFGPDTADVRDLFGGIEGNKSDESRIAFYDAFLKGGFRKGFRDGVRIGEDGTAEDTGKFDCETVELTGKDSYFTFRVSVDKCTGADKELLGRMIAGINGGGIRLGHKAARGFGRVCLSSLREKTVATARDYIGFTWDGLKEEPDFLTEAKERSYAVTFRNRSFLTVANNATLEKKEDGGLINAEPVKDASGRAVIPGSSWAGVFRHHFGTILRRSGALDGAAREEFLDRVFGSTERASQLIFDESVLDGAILMQQTRNAIDRFTGGASDKKLFTNQFAFGGTLTLRVSLRPGLTEEETARVKNLIDLTVNDLDDGTLNVGAQGSVGAGMLKKIKEEGGL